MSAKTLAVENELLKRENTRLKLLCARLAEWHNLPVGPLEANPKDGMTLAIQFPNGSICWPVDRRYMQGIWHQFSGEMNVDKPTPEQEDLILNQLISGVMVKTIRTYFEANENKEQSDDEARG